ncbi:MAG: GNAT family N-acetyltransferase [Erythrobacter sp.]|jgi:GNAT superfamily N-acetyltransferase|uniref:GNAT family N-acetyltransferase n=1 Tax=Erythrobacter sp. TaxID=1042 RepID=UPI002B4A0CBB|nr:GNAT family N-acetyltransferase [Erythrobacter sp.]WRH69991.1 MAG: GNAT family N-acetyltransferase [Erythrobacter sp.]
MIYRPAILADAPALAVLGAETFVAAFGHLYTPEDLSAFLAQVHNPEAVAGEIAGNECTHCLVEHEGQLIAFCKLRYPSHYASYSDAANPLELGQLYALPGHTGHGIGAQLMDWALGVARERGHDAVLLSVYSENFGAQRFYQRYGFGKIADITFQVGDHFDPEFLYELKL